VYYYQDNMLSLIISINSREFGFDLIKVLINDR
jgi:hypothetical protein